MTNAKTIARVFTYLSHKIDEEPMTKTRINKLIFFAQGHSLGERGKPLFLNEIDAWDYGPVVPTVYGDFDKIAARAAQDDLQGIGLTGEEIELIMDVWNQYGGYTASKLTDITHQSGTPWLLTYVAGQRNVHIPKELMREYFSRPENRLPRAMNGLDSIPVTDALPKEEYDPQEDDIWEALTRGDR